MKLTAEVIEAAEIRFNPIGDRELKLRDLSISEIENLGVTNNGVDCIDLTNNEIQHFGNFPSLTRLKVLMLSNNRISSIQDMMHSNLVNLRTLILSNNRITSMDEVTKLSNFASLEILCLIDNPVSFVQDYRLRAINLFPKLKFLDYQKISADERKKASDKFGIPSENNKTTSNKRKFAELLADAIKNAETADEIREIEALILAGKHEEVLKFTRRG